MKGLATWLLLALLLSACSKPDPEPQGTVFDDTIDAARKAEAVEQQLEEAAAQRSEAIEDQGG